MAEGIKIVKENFSIASTNPDTIVIDTTSEGAFKIASIIKLVPPYTPTRTYLNGLGVNVGVVEVSHNLGYSPAFIAYKWAPAIAGFEQQGSSHSVLPTSGPVGGPALHARINKNTVIVDGLPDDGSQLITIFIMSENLDS